VGPRLRTLNLKIKLSLLLTKHHAMKTHGGVKVQLHAFLTSVLNGGEWSASRSCLPGDWMGPAEN
jgi:hypothetical protein